MLDVCQTDRDRTRADQSVLYITYSGLLEPPGCSQIAPFVSRLADAGVPTRVISFEKANDRTNRARADALRSRLELEGAEWTALRFHRRPRVAATALDLLTGIAVAVRLARAKRPDVVHARGYVAGVIGWAIALLFRSRFVFEMRGFWPEERVELGLFRPHGLLYRASKSCERLLLDAADHVVVLTESARAILRDREAAARLESRRVREKQITVVPCFTDLTRFEAKEPDEELRREHDLEGRIVIGNVGAVNKRYMLPEMFRFAYHVKSHRPETRFLYLTRERESLVRPAARDAGLPDDDLVVVRAVPDDVPRWLMLFRLGVFFLRPSYAAKASSLTTLAEFLAAGVPVVTNHGVGDLDRLLGSSPCGLVVPGLRDADLAAAARRALPFLAGEHVPDAVRESCRKTAAAHFDLQEGARRHLSIYRSLALADEEGAGASVAVELS